jgi:hypothetical protein
VLIRIQLFTLIPDPDLVFHFNADLDIATIGLPTDPPGLFFERPRLHFEPRNLIFLFKSDPDLSSKNDADPDQKI